VEATGRRHRASIASDNSVWTRMPHFFLSIFTVDPLKRGLRWRQGP
jgi:hypothetical protein